MKNTLTIPFLLMLPMLLLACSNGASTAELAAAAACADISPTTSVQTLSGNCRIASGEERILVEGLSLATNGDAVDIVFKTNDASVTTPATGVRLKLDNNSGSLRLTYMNPANGNTCSSNLTTGSIASKACIELHNESNVVHAVAASGSSCDGSLLVSDAAVLFNTESGQGASTSCTGTALGAAGTYPTGSHITYYRTAGGTATKISTSTKRITE